MQGDSRFKKSLLIQRGLICSVCSSWGARTVSYELQLITEKKGSLYSELRHVGSQQQHEALQALFRAHGKLVPYNPILAIRKSPASTAHFHRWPVQLGAARVFSVLTCGLEELENELPTLQLVLNLLYLLSHSCTFMFVINYRNDNKASLTNTSHSLHYSSLRVAFF